MLYKYLSPERVDVLENRLIRFTQPAAFNDPFEMQSILDKRDFRNFLDESVNVDEIAELAYKKQPRNYRRKIPFAAYRKQFTEERVRSLASHFGRMLADRVDDTSFYSGMNKAMGILSLTEHKENLLMWAHYADSHRGFVLGVGKNHDFFSKANKNQRMYKVSYGDQLPTTKITELKNIQYLVNKGIDWAYENEWRYIRGINDASETIPKDDYDICLFDFEPDLVKSVYLGCRIGEPVSKKILQTLKHPDYSHVEIFQALINKAQFSLDFTQIK